MHSELFLPTLYLLAAVVTVPIAARFKLGSVLGYICAGMLIGLMPGVGEETRELKHFAEFGVVMMLFIVGLELAPGMLWDMRHRLLGLGGLQILLSTGAVFAACLAFGYTWQVSMAIGLVLALSSTAIVLQTLTEKGLVKTSGGRSVFSVLLMQDIAVVPILALIPLLLLGGKASIEQDGSITRAVEEAETHHTLFESLPAWGVTLTTLGTIGLIILAGVYLARPIFRYIHAANLREMYTALALLIVIGIAYIMTLIGLSPALGAFLAGVVLANSEFRHELETDIEPFKGLLLGLFFITVGASIDFNALFAEPLLFLGLALGLILLKGLVLFAIGFGFGLRHRELWLFTFALAQAGEFGFVLISFATQQRVFGDALGDTLTLVIALSMLLTPLLFILYDLVAKALDAGPEDILAEDEITESGTVLIAGIGRFGQIVNRLVQASGFKTVVLDNNIKRIEAMRKFGAKAFLGDPTRADLLKAAGLAEAKVFVIAVDNQNAAEQLARHARRMNPEIHIIARAYDRRSVFALYEAGANDIVREMFDSSLRAGRYVLEHLGMTEYEAAKAQQAFYQHDRAGIRELAELWDPDRDMSTDPAFMARIQELRAELEADLLAIHDKETKG